MAKITFLQGTPQQYAALAAKDANTLYFIFDKSASTASLYLGDRYVAGITNLADLYDVAISDLANNDILLYNVVSQSWENCSLADIAAKIAVELEYASIQTALDGINVALSNKADAKNVYTKSETDVAISSAVVAASHLKRQIVSSLEQIDVNAANALAYIYMLSTGTLYGDNKYDEYLVIETNNGDRSLERVGSWEVSLDDYAKLADVLAALDAKADKGTSLSSYGILDAYSKDEIDAQVLQLSTNIATEVTRATGVEKTLSDSLDTAILKLNTIESGAQVNIIDSVSTLEFSITNKLLELKSIPASKITNLSAHEALQQLNKSIGANTAQITSNTGVLQQITNELNAYVKKTKYDQDIASLTDATTWHELY